MLHYYPLFLLLSCLLSSAYGQDERYYRQLLTGELPQVGQLIQELPLPQFNVLGPSYKVDLNADGVEEFIQPQKRDGHDWLEIRDFSQRKVFEAKLFAMGSDSHIYKLQLVHITPTVKTLIIFMDEGFTRGRRFESSGRIFLLTFENNDLNKITLTQGPHFFHEREAQREQYWRRTYMVNVYDMDNDGTREIVVMYNHIQRILKYSGKGEWVRI